LEKPANIVKRWENLKKLEEREKASRGRASKNLFFGGWNRLKNPYELKKKVWACQLPCLSGVFRDPLCAQNFVKNPHRGQKKTSGFIGVCISTTKRHRPQQPSHSLIT
jgi:hypothetical protein